ncbi:hypothetical protein F2P81_004199 [Scophthalmus maximus]|uniref:Uncharacterized protein n=1 Tax=Scophthalmus maximus TaxID=52904 RepID=A0A6A4TLJ1_SCOMX|nr:hypothetical protein F2P81_004199 [Scophthalmus maximus]
MSRKRRPLALWQTLRGRVAAQRSSEPERESRVGSDVYESFVFEDSSPETHPPPPPPPSTAASDKNNPELKSLQHINSVPLDSAASFPVGRVFIFPPGGAAALCQSLSFRPAARLAPH